MCLKIAFRQIYVTVCGKLSPNEGGVVGCVDRMRAKFSAKWGVQMTGMNFQTRFSSLKIYSARPGMHEGICPDGILKINCEHAPLFCQNAKKRGAAL